MRYIWEDNLRLHHLSNALTASARLTEHLKAATQMARRVNSQKVLEQVELVAEARFHLQIQKMRTVSTHPWQQ